MYDQECEKFVEEQRRSAKAQRLVMLQKDLTAEKKMLVTLLLPVLQSVEGLEMEHEMVSLTGIKIYGDFFFKTLRMIIESDGYAVHAENITRDRFSFEKMRIRTIAMYGYRYIPFSWDDLDKRPEVCRRTLYELIGRYSTNTSNAFMELSVYERELLRFALRLHSRISLSDACYCLQMGQQPTRKVLRNLLDKQLIKPVGSGQIRHHQYELEEKGRQLLL
jgi:very-short-patch-repair endonuclease